MNTKNDLSLLALRAANISRSKTWMALGTWTVMEWACAMAGEAGEACNVAKKIRRRDMKQAKRAKDYEQNLDAMLAEECADTLIYMDLLCASRGLDLAQAVKDKFNKVSKEFGFPEEL